jgi:hypothetical protein
MALLALTVAACAPTATPAADPVKIELAASPNPPATGDVELTITLSDPSGRPVDNAQVDLLASHTGMAGMDLQGQATAQGRYTITADFSMSGDWKVTVEVRGMTGQTIRKDFDLPVK